LDEREDFWPQALGSGIEMQALTRTDDRVPGVLVTACGCQIKSASSTPLSLSSEAPKLEMKLERVWDLGQ